MESELRAAAKSAGVTFDGSAAFGGLVAGRFRLHNGLTIIFAPDDRAPVFAYQTWFRVGSRDESPQRTGLAHLFEHLMFKGTRQHAAGEFDREMERRGSQTNAATWVDWTYYHQALAARGDNFATVVDFEVDRMVNLVLDEQTFRSELEVVKNERRMSVDDSPVGTLSEKLFALAYREHSYRWPTIGAMEHLAASTIDDLERFYRSFYAPNNAVVAVAGALDPGEALRLLAKRYGALEPQPIERPARRPEPEQREVRREQIRMPIVAPQLIIAYHSPAQIDPSFPALEVASDALTSGDSSRLYRKLVIEQEVATEVDAFVAPFAEPGLFEILLTLRPGVDPDSVVDTVQAELEAMAAGPTPRELIKAKNSFELGWLDSLKDAEGCAEALGQNEVNYGDYALAWKAGARWAAVEGPAVAAIAKSVFRRDNRTAVIATPAEGG